ncbi:hypothetical protein GCK72_023872 [Caenorhabditis remanei]|uniref:Uncharacterized protein n=1 Tax=Caenorhabditis remanei TaxID=31234 RepID=A0A6A5FXM2_CAERE|nr:hypothetical protein GCK72_023872 [Caenorhabditis remanei]KAF1747410.1 hypothetical protein GCK72_023872 [Caenorhabditis remanei]
MESYDLINVLMDYWDKYERYSTDRNSTSYITKYDGALLRIESECDLEKRALRMQEAIEMQTGTGTSVTQKLPVLKGPQFAEVRQALKTLRQKYATLNSRSIPRFIKKEKERQAETMRRIKEVSRQKIQAILNEERPRFLREAYAAREQAALNVAAQQQPKEVETDSVPPRNERMPRPNYRDDDSSEEEDDNDDPPYRV